MDMLGFGLHGTSGLTTYVIFLGMIGFIGYMAYRDGAPHIVGVAGAARFDERSATGDGLETLAIARLAWAMHVTLNSGMELRRALTLSLASTQNAFYTRHIDDVVRAITKGREIHKALKDTGSSGSIFCDAVQVGEESGNLVESMGNLSAQYQDQARVAMNTLSMLLGVLVTMFIGGIIIYLIYQMFTRALWGRSTTR